MVIRYLTPILIFMLVLSCRHTPADTSAPGQKGQVDMAELNQYMVRKDRERIQNYISRKNLKMTETSTGLWYQIVREGEGRAFGEGDRLIMDYECSLLDGTKCYSSAEQGPKELTLGRSELEAGLNEGLKLLRPGAQAIFIIPPFLAYGLVGDRKRIPPRAVVVYTVTVRSE